MDGLFKPWTVCPGHLGTALFQRFLLFSQVVSLGVSVSWPLPSVLQAYWTAISWQVLSDIQFDVASLLYDVSHRHLHPVVPVESPGSNWWNSCALYPFQSPLWSLWILWAPYCFPRNSLTSSPVRTEQPTGLSRFPCLQFQLSPEPRHSWQSGSPGSVFPWILCLTGVPSLHCCFGLSCLSLWVFLLIRQQLITQRVTGMWKNFTELSCQHCMLPCLHQPGHMTYHGYCLIFSLLPSSTFSVCPQSWYFDIFLSYLENSSTRPCFFNSAYLD